VTYGSGYVVTGWNYDLKDASQPFFQRCYYEQPLEHGLAATQTIAVNGSPRREPAPPRAYRAGQSVVYGTIVSVRRENQGADVVYVFEVAESWKRPLEPEITVHSGTTCSFEANAGEKYAPRSLRGLPAIGSRRFLALC
jgi:hypothetical protein